MESHLDWAFSWSVLVNLSAYRNSPLGMPRMPGAPWSLQDTNFRSIRGDFAVQLERTG